MSLDLFEGDLRREMASVTLFSLVLIQVELMLRDESMGSIQNKRHRVQPAMDDLQLWLHQQTLLVLSASLRKKWVWIIGWIVKLQSRQRGAAVNSNRNEFEDVNRDETIFAVILHEDFFPMVKFPWQK